MTKNGTAKRIKSTHTHPQTSLCLSHQSYRNSGCAGMFKTEQYITVHYMRHLCVYVLCLVSTPNKPTVCGLLTLVDPATTTDKMQLLWGRSYRSRCCCRRGRYSRVPHRPTHSHRAGRDSRSLPSFGACGPYFLRPPAKKGEKQTNKHALLRATPSYSTRCPAGARTYVRREVQELVVPAKCRHHALEVAVLQIRPGDLFQPGLVHYQLADQHAHVAAHVRVLHMVLRLLYHCSTGGMESGINISQGGR